MSKYNCKAVQRELNELESGDEFSPFVVTHLLDCDICRDFQEKEIALRRLVGSLGTVEAPADFDFRLRARMARAEMTATDHLSRRLLTIAVSILLFIGIVGWVRYVQFNRSENPVVAGAGSKVEPTPSVQPNPVRSSEPSVPIETARVVDERTNSARISTGAGKNTNRSKRQIISSDFSGTEATIYGPNNPLTSSRVFPIDGSMQSLKLSLDDGRGNARTISLPGVSFGSQRVLANSNQPAPKDIW